MRTTIKTAALVLAALCFGVIETASGANAVVSDPYNLPPPGGPGWYAVPGQSVSFYVEYGTNLGIPAENTFTGILVRAHSMIVDNFRNVTNWYTGSDQVIRFDACLTATLEELSNIAFPWVITLPGYMQVRLVNRLGHPTGTFPLVVEELSFTLRSSDLGIGGTNAILGIRTTPSLSSEGQLAVNSLGGGKYEVTSSLNVYSEAAAYRTDHWLPYWPDTNAPTTYQLKPLQAPATSLAQASGTTTLRFDSRRNVRYVVERSPDLRAWTPVQTNYAGGCGPGDKCSFIDASSGGAGFFHLRGELIPLP